MIKTTILAILVFISGSFISSGNAFAQNAKEQAEPLLIVRVFESDNPLHQSEITITDGNEILNTSS